MTPTWFNTPERVAALLLASSSWIGTPFFRDSCERGRGVCCSKFVSAVYRESGCCEVEIPSGSISHARFARESVVVPFVQALPMFSEVTTEKMLPGDLLGIKIGKVVHHLGIVLLGTQFIHALDGPGVAVSTIDDATWASRLHHVWRPTP